MQKEPAQQPEPLLEDTSGYILVNTKASSLFGRRVRATLLDHMSAGCILVSFLVMVLPALQNVMIGFGTGILLVVGIFTLMEARRKASFGMSLMGLTLGSGTVFWRLLWRNLLRFLPTLAVLGLLTAIVLGEPLQSLVDGAWIALSFVVLYNVFSLTLGKESLANQLSGFKVTVAAKPHYNWWIVAMTGWVMVGGVGLGIAMPHSAGSCSSPLTPKAYMHTLQTIAETYAVDWGGQYAPSVQVLEQEARKPGREYWKTWKNSYTEYEGYGKSYANEWDPKSEGLVTYEPIGPAYTKYYIYGYDKKGQRIQNKGKDFFLTNS